MRSADDPLDQLRDAVDVLVAHAGGRLVEQQHLRIERQRGRDLQRALAAIGQFDRRPVDDIGQADIGDQRQRALVEIDRARGVDRQKSNEPPRWRCNAMRTFSSTVSAGNTAEI